MGNMEMETQDGNGSGSDRSGTVRSSTPGVAAINGSRCRGGAAVPEDELRRRACTRTRAPAAQDAGYLDRTTTACRTEPQPSQRERHRDAARALGAGAGSVRGSLPRY